MFQVRSITSSQLSYNSVRNQSYVAGEDVASPLCCSHSLSPRVHDGSLDVDAVLDTTSADQANTEKAGFSPATGSYATRWKRVVPPSDILAGLSSMERSSISSEGVSPAYGTHPTPSYSLTAPFASAPFSFTLKSVSASTSAQLVSTLTSLSIFVPSLISTSICQTPTVTLPSSSTSDAIGLPPGSSSSTSTDADTSTTSFVTVITLSSARSRPFTMSNSDTITSASVYPTSTMVYSTTRTSATQPASNTTSIPTVSSTPFFIPPFLSPTFFSPIPSTSDFPTPITSSFSSISAISLNSISTNDPTTISTSAVTGGQTVSSVETGTLSTDIPHNTGFAHQTGAIVGVGIAGTFVLLLIILLVFFACKRHRSNRSYNSPTEGILTVSRNASWRPPLEADDDVHFLATYGHSVAPNYSKTSGERGLIGDHLSREDSSVDATGSWPASEGQPLVPPLVQTRYGSSNLKNPLFLSRSLNDGYGNSQPRWGNTEPFNVSLHNSPQQLPLTINSHATALGSRSTSSSEFDEQNRHLGHGSSGGALLPKGNRRTFTVAPRLIHDLSENRHYSTALVLGRDTGLEYGTQRIRQYQEEQNQQDRADKSISQLILARLRASRRSSTAPTVKAYSESHCTTMGSEYSTPSRAPSLTYSPSLLNPPIYISQPVPHLHPSRGATGSRYTPDINNTHNQHLLRQGARGTSEGLRWSDNASPPSPSPVPTDASSMVEGLLHPRLGMALASSQQASATSLRDHEDYSRPINGHINNHIRSTTTFETQELGEEGA